MIILLIIGFQVFGGIYCKGQSCFGLEGWGMGVGRRGLL